MFSFAVVVTVVNITRVSFKGVKGSKVWELITASKKRKDNEKIILNILL